MASSDQSIIDLYRNAGRPDPTPQEIAVNAANPGGLAAVAALLQSDNKALGFNQPAAVASTTATDTGFGAAPPVFAPAAVAGANFGQQSYQNYTAPQFTVAAPTFTAPTVGDISNDPGVAYGIQQAQRAEQTSAASKGTVLNARTQQALGQDISDYANTQYGTVFNRASQTFTNNLANYGAQWNVFQGNAQDAFQANQANQSGNNSVIAANNATAQQGVNNAQQGFNNAGTTYGVNALANETAQTDYWNRLNSVANAGLTAATA